MRWKIEIDKLPNNNGVLFIKKHAKNYDTSNVKWIKIAEGKDNKVGVHGICLYPNHKNKGYYRISCFVPGPVPFNVPSYGKGYIYKTGDKMPPTPKGSIIDARGVHVINGVKTRWKRIKSFTELNTYNDSILWIFAHEFFHFLADSKQIDIKNTESNADAYADEFLIKFQNSQN